MGETVLVSGSRSIEDWEFIADVLDDVNRTNWEIDTIIHGDAPGVDQGANMWAKQRPNKNVEVHPVPEWVWEKIGRKAGPLRNSYMLGRADAVCAIWDGESSGTADVIHKAEGDGIPIRKLVVDVDDGDVTDVKIDTLVEDDQTDLYHFENE